MSLEDEDTDDYPNQESLDIINLLSFYPTFLHHQYTENPKSEIYIINLNTNESRFKNIEK
jgi:hypothetical protein